MRRDLRWALGLLAFAPVYLACSGDPALPPCSPLEKARVEADFIEEATRVCDGLELEECGAFDAIDRKYQERRLAVRKGCR